METRLDTLTTVVFDCQASHPNPARGHLLEAAWGIFSNYHIDDPPFEKFTDTRIKPDSDFEIPRQVARVTGISLEDLQGGTPAESVWQQLQKDSRQVCETLNLERSPMVIHYSRYEEPYLKHLHTSFSPNDLFPFDIICTHKISQRLWPELPRRGLRAVAGYLGYSVDEFRRSVHHIQATAWIWRHVTTVLVQDRGIETLDELKTWLEEKSGPKKTNERIYPMAKEKRTDLPQKPGIYRMSRSNGDVLYIGKATSLRQRVNSYFQKKTPHAEHKLEMLSQAVDLSFTETPTALEAALLETDEIKRLLPPYNIALKPGNREMVFSNPSFISFSSQASTECNIGPFPSSNPLKSFSILAGILMGREIVDETTGESLLNIPAEFAPDPDCLNQGVEVFKEQNGRLLPENVTVEILFKLAAILHQLKLDLAAEADEHEEFEEGDDDNPEAVFEWTPENVSSHLEGVLRYGGRLRRQSRWLCDLTESVVAWRDRAPDTMVYHMIVIQGGKVIKSIETQQFRSIPVPPGTNRPLVQRKVNLDLETYDRLRVLTTEIRRLVTEPREVYLRLGHNRMFDRNKLTRRLLWL